jgi:hypothetical protein
MVVAKLCTNSKLSVKVKWLEEKNSYQYSLLLLLSHLWIWVYFSAFLFLAIYSPYIQLDGMHDMVWHSDIPYQMPYHNTHTSWLQQYGIGYHITAAVNHTHMGMVSSPSTKYNPLVLPGHSGNVLTHSACSIVWWLFCLSAETRVQPHTEAPLQDREWEEKVLWLEKRVIQVISRVREEGNHMLMRQEIQLAHPRDLQGSTYTTSHKAVLLVISHNWPISKHQQTRIIPMLTSSWT